MHKNSRYAARRANCALPAADPGPATRHSCQQPPRDGRQPPTYNRQQQPTPAAQPPTGSVALMRAPKVRFSRKDILSDDSDGEAGVAAACVARVQGRGGGGGGGWGAGKRGVGGKEMRRSDDVQMSTAVSPWWTEPRRACHHHALPVVRIGALSPGRVRCAAAAGGGGASLELPWSFPGASLEQLLHTHTAAATVAASGQHRLSAASQSTEHGGQECAGTEHTPAPPSTPPSAMHARMHAGCSSTTAAAWHRTCSTGP